ncbi:MAG: hypothetical protein D3913_07680 [Candidatus Electrothrix sp. LOE1_4_5]|nr:hypothetical protein [Candidatus Electrothrix gigas]MCI5196013.1 hypothetical protein [Candidatus Electrothrix gigas]
MFVNGDAERLFFRRLLLCISSDGGHPALGNGYVAGEDYAVEEAKINPHFPVGKVAIYPNHIP